jgi:uncharacterized protein (DUF305 family)
MAAMSPAATRDSDHLPGDTVPGTDDADGTDGTDGVDEPGIGPAGGGAGREPGADDHSGGGPGDAGDDEGGGGGGGGGRGPGVGWARALVLAAATAFLGLAVGIFVSRDDPPGEGSVDVGFYQDMLTHHKQALGVATLELSYGEDSVVRSYAAEVLMFQAQEVGVMRQALADWGYDPDARPDVAMAWMGMPVPTDQMPGLLDDDQMSRMQEARGADADRLFLELMAEHHRGGLHMAGQARSDAADADVRRLAGLMARAQAQEINEYRLHAERAGIDVDIPPADVPPADLPDS